ncbi:MAG: TlyA family RNA methyltransferase [Spirochaetia bacterium]|nr:TlyA family RNA methyltransferase [Spirochaetia bacterium]
MKKRRRALLQLLCERYPDIERERLLAMIMCRDVAVDGGRITDPRLPVAVDALIELHEGGYVSRGGIKLQHAIRTWDLEIRGNVFLDAGASTGGFTDALLQHGARAVYAVDVGYNQLAYSLRSDRRVTSMEQTNIMHVDGLEPAPAAAVADLSFRSISGAASHILGMCTLGWMVALIKPQFELNHELTEFDGVIRDPEDVQRVMMKVFAQLKEEGVGVVSCIRSPIRGAKGNVEYLAKMRMADDRREEQLNASGFRRSIEDDQKLPLS